MGCDILAGHARAQSDKKSGGMLSATYQRTSKNAESPGEPIKLMSHIDLCTKQREERMGFCVKEGHSGSYCVFYNLMGHNVSPIYNGQALHPELLCQLWRNEGSGQAKGRQHCLTERTIRRHAANLIFCHYTHCSADAVCRNKCK